MSSTSERRIHKLYKSQPTIEGAGVHLKRAFGYNNVPEFDPFLMLDDFHNTDPEKYLAGFPWHPHRGIETITYILEGIVEHGDSMGHTGSIGAGDVQWMTAGGGIIHQEMPKESPTGMMWGFQFWANLPAAKKMMEPRYRDVTAASIPTLSLPSGALVKVIAGRVNGTDGPVHDIVIEPEFLDVSMPAASVFSHPIEPGHTVFAYVLSGEAYFDDRRDPFAYDVATAGWLTTERKCICDAETVVLYEHEGDAVTVTTEANPARFVLLSGKPLGEPVAWYGPIVMNTKDELKVALSDYRDGTFLRHD